MPIPRGHPVKGTVLTDHVRSVDWTTRKVEYWCDLPDEFLDLVSRRICKLIS
jgi:mRNA-degrading endonuclease toxin of MazEF toxin-antitoxin module